MSPSIGNGYPKKTERHLHEEREEKFFSKEPKVEIVMKTNKYMEQCMSSISEFFCYSYALYKTIHIILEKFFTFSEFFCHQTKMWLCNEQACVNTLSMQR